MPRNNTIAKSKRMHRSRKSHSKTKSGRKSRRNYINMKSRYSYKSRRKYRGGCGKSCGISGSQQSNSGTWKSTGSMHGGSHPNPEQISKDTFDHVTDSIFHSAA